mgnify:CR=1 FL=1
MDEFGDDDVELKEMSAGKRSGKKGKLRTFRQSVTLDEGLNCLNRLAVFWRRDSR